MESKPNRRKLKNFLTRNDAQLRLVLNNLIFLIAVMFVLIAILLSPIYYDMQLSDQLWTQYVSANILWRLLYRIASAILVIVLLAVVNQIVFSHRICGPLVNFGNTYKSVIRGDLTRHVHLRRHDFLKPEAVLVNRMLETFGDSIVELKRNQQILSAAADELQSEAKLDSQTVELLRQALKENEVTLNFWHTKN